MSYAIKIGTQTYFNAPPDYTPAVDETLEADAPSPPSPAHVWTGLGWELTAEGAEATVRGARQAGAAALREELKGFVGSLPVSARTKIYRELWPSLEPALGAGDIEAAAALLAEFEVEPEFSDLKKQALQLVEAALKG